MTKPLQFCEKWQKMSGPGDACNVRPGPDRQRTVGGSAMPANGDEYSDSARSGKTEQPANTWKSLGDLARALAEGVAKK